MPKWTIEYTLPGERGKLHKKSGDGDQSYHKAVDDIKRKGGNVKSTSFSRSTERRIVP